MRRQRQMDRVLSPLLVRCYVLSSNLALYIAPCSHRVMSCYLFWSLLAACHGVLCNNLRIESSYAVALSSSPLLSSPLLSSLPFYPFIALYDMILYDMTTHDMTREETTRQDAKRRTKQDTSKGDAT